MPITKIIIENFKGIRDRVEIPVRPLTLLFGANSAGKTTVLHALLYLRELLERQNADADRVIGGGKDIYLGGFRQMIHGHDESKTITVGVVYKVDDDGCRPYPLQDQSTLLAAFDSSTTTSSLSADSPGTNQTKNVIDLQFKKRIDTLGDLLVNGVPGIKEVGIEVTVGIPSEDSKPTVLQYLIFINGVRFARISRESGLLTVLDDIATRHPLFSAFDLEQSDEQPPQNEFSDALEQALQCGHTLESRLASSQVIVLSGAVVPAFGQALEFELDEPEDEFDLRSVARLILSQLVVRPGELIRDHLRTYRHLGPIRAVPDLSSMAQRSPSADRWIDGMAAWDLLSADAMRQHRSGFSLVREVDDYLKDQSKLNLGYSLSTETVRDFPADSPLTQTLERLLANPEEFEQVAALRAAYAEVMSRPTRSQLRLTDLKRHVTVNPPDIGAGVSQVIPVLVSVLDTGSNVTAIEQPELHLHPAIQCSLGDLFIRQVNQNSERFFLLETHSEHLLLRLMRRMRETMEDSVPEPDVTLSPESITILFVETYEGRSVYREMPLNERGELVKAWPGGFFEEDLDEII